MADQWYYEAEGNRQGPFSGRELVALAAAGRLKPTDTVWKEGVARGVPAHRVKHLFPPAPSAPPEAPPPPAQAPEPPAEPAPAAAAAAPNPAPGGGPAAPEAAEEQAALAREAGRPAENPPAQAAYKPPPQQQQKKGRAVAVSGAVIVSQDGYTAYFRKVCPKCGHEDTGRTRMVIRVGLITRVSFFCPKCRKAQQAQIQSIA